MRILQIGAPKSGNLWLYHLIQAALQHAGIPRRSFIQRHPIYPLAQTWPLSHARQADIDMLDVEAGRCCYRISSVFRMPIEDLDAYLAQCTHVWTHSVLCPRSFAVYPQFDKIVYIVRDPRDRLVSASAFAFTPYMRTFYPHGEASPEAYRARRLPEAMTEWVVHAGDHLRYRHALHLHVVCFERLLHAFEATLTKLLAYLDLPSGPAFVDRIRQDVRFSAMKRQNPQHVRAGRSGQWRDVLTPEQQREATSRTAPLLALLGYPALDADAAPTLPGVPTGLSQADVERALGWTE